MTSNRQRASPGSRAGTTLIELMTACLILSVMAVATGSYLYYARAQVAIQQDKRVALEVANSRLESVRAAAFTLVDPPSSNYTAYYLDFMTGAWRVGGTDPGETVIINGGSFPMTTTVQYMDADGGSSSYDCLKVAVSVRYRKSTSDAVTLGTVKAP